MIGNTEPRDISDLEPGDLIIFDLRSHQDSAYTGHTMIVLENDKENKKLTVGEGHLDKPPEEKT